VNQRDPRGLTALHRAAYLAQYDGYLELYEYLLVRLRVRARCNGRLTRAQSEGADPGILSDDFDPYLQPGRHAPADLATEPEVC